MKKILAFLFLSLIFIPQSYSDADSKKLYSEFKKAQIEIEKALRHQAQSEVKQVQNAQNGQAKYWRNNERKTRREFFDQHLSGPERREYVQKYLVRKKEFDQGQKESVIAVRKIWAEKIEQSKKRFLEQEIEFKKQLDLNQRPSPDLWPRDFGNVPSPAPSSSP